MDIVSNIFATFAFITAVILILTMSFENLIPNWLLGIGVLTGIGACISLVLMGVIKIWS